MFICTLDADAIPDSIRGMSSETWFEKAERLSMELARLDAAQLEDESVKRVALARWLRAEFSEEPPEDTHTLALFPGRTLQ